MFALEVWGQGSEGVCHGACRDLSQGGQGVGRYGADAVHRRCRWAEEWSAGRAVRAWGGGGGGRKEAEAGARIALNDGQGGGGACW